MHSASGTALDRFGTEVHAQSVPCSHHIDYIAEGNGVICGCQGIGLPEIDLVLAGACFMV